ncbi:MAG: hypothetical protein KDJ90_00375 [Nitratireductor sp.]|nr:hypothetical protein [Nitratireductor sp.]
MRANLNDLIRQQGARQRSDPNPIPLPFGGVNLSAPYGGLKKGEARKALNFFPLDGRMSMRQGYSVLKTRTAPVSILGYDLPAAAGCLAIDADGWALNIGEDDTIVPIARSSGLSPAKQLSGAINSGRLCVVDGTNAGIKHFDGLSLTSAALTGDYAAYVWAGILGHQNRLFMWQENSLDFFYLGTDAIQGEVKKFSLSFLARLTGSIRAMASWTVDASQGTNDLLAIITTTGQVAVYEGNDPGDALNWRLNGIYHIGAVPGADGWVNVGGDLRIATKQGIVSASEMLTAGEASATATTTVARNIIPWFIEAGAVTGKDRYWQAMIDPKGYGVWFNMPTSTGSRQAFFAASNLKPYEFDLPIVEMARGGKTMWFVTSAGEICKAWSGYSDGGAFITGEWHSDWLPAGSKGASVDGIQYVFGCESGIFLTLSILSDYRESATAIGEVEQEWQLDPLDGVCDDELSASGEGEALQFRMSVENRYIEEIKWIATKARTVGLARSR